MQPYSDPLPLHFCRAYEAKPLKRISKFGTCIDAENRAELWCDSFTMAICRICGKKYNRLTTPVSAKRVCSECFFARLEAEASATDLQPAEERPSGRESQPLPPPQSKPPSLIPGGAGFGVRFLARFIDLVYGVILGLIVGIVAGIVFAVLAYLESSPLNGLNASGKIA